MNKFKNKIYIFSKATILLTVPAIMLTIESCSSSNNEANNETNNDVTQPLEKTKISAQVFNNRVFTFNDPTSTTATNGSITLSNTFVLPIGTKIKYSDESLSGLFKEFPISGLKNLSEGIYTFRLLIIDATKYEWENNVLPTEITIHISSKTKVSYSFSNNLLTKVEPTTHGGTGEIHIKNNLIPSGVSLQYRKGGESSFTNITLSSGNETTILNNLTAGQYIFKLVLNNENTHAWINGVTPDEITITMNQPKVKVDPSFFIKSIFIASNPTTQNGTNGSIEFIDRFTMPSGVKIQYKKNTGSFHDFPIAGLSDLEANSIFTMRSIITDTANYEWKDNAAPNNIIIEIKNPKIQVEPTNWLKQSFNVTSTTNDTGFVSADVSFSNITIPTGILLRYKLSTESTYTDVSKDQNSIKITTEGYYDFELKLLSNNYEWKSGTPPSSIRIWIGREKLDGSLFSASIFKVLGPSSPISTLGSLEIVSTFDFDDATEMHISGNGISKTFTTKTLDSLPVGTYSIEWRIKESAKNTHILLPASKIVQITIPSIS